MADEILKRDANSTVVAGGITDDANEDIRNLLVDASTGRLKVSAVISGSTPLTTKGDILSYTTEEVRIAVGANGEVLTANSAVAAGVEWSTAGSGDVVGPGSATNNAFARFDLTTGKLIQDSLVTSDDSGSVNIPTGQTYKINGTALAVGDITGAAPLDSPTFTTAITIPETAAASDTDKFLVADTGVIKFRTGTQVLSDIGGQASLTFGIADTNAVQINGVGVADNDYAKFTASGLEGRSFAEVKSDLSLDNVENTALTTWPGSTNLVTLGTIATGTWEGTTIAVDQGGTGQTSYTDGQLLIGNTTGNTLAKATLTAGEAIDITNGNGTITILAEDASVTNKGVAELATTAEIDTGTDSTRTIPVDQFVASKRNIRWLVFNLVEAGTDVATATNIGGDWLSPIAGTILQSDTTPFFLYATNSTAGTTGTMVVDISLGGTTIMDTNKLDFDTTEKTTTTAATPPDLSDTTLAVGDILTIDIDAIHTTPAKGLTVYMAIRE